MKYYKVVNATLTDDRFFSAFVEVESLRTEYKIGEFVFTDFKTPFMVFDNFASAKVFADWSVSRPLIFECEVVNPRKWFGSFFKLINKLKYSEYFFDKTSNKIKSKYGMEFNSSRTFLEGTIFCDGVKLVNRVG